MAGKISDDDDIIAEINIVPFVDIILVVLIIFMVTAPMIVKPGIKIALPKAASADKSTPSKFNVSITSEGNIELNGQATGEEQLKAFAKKHLLEKPDAQAIISADKAISHGEVIKVIDWIKSSGITKFAIATEK